MPDIILTTLNARYIHSAFGLRYLHANLGELKPRCEILEFDINQRPVDVAEALLASQPQIIGIGIYLWNITPATELVELLRQLAPATRIVLGGPEVSHGTTGLHIASLADHIIAGEADLAFAELCRTLLSGGTAPQRIQAPLPDLNALAFPYTAYSDADIAHRIVYVEASRGCPFSCEFCLSSVDQPVRAFPTAPFLTEMEQLLARGARHFKFIDRTFNLNLRTSTEILRFFLERWQPGMFLHFEMVPDRFPAELREWIARFPPGALQFEVGIQTFNPEAAARISRRQNYQRLGENLTFLRHHTGAHIHADLIVGLPGEDLASFAAGFDRLVHLAPQEIQVGILKRLKGTPIGRHDAEFAMTWSQRAPYELLRNRDLDFPTLQGLKRFARYWDLTSNSGRFPHTLPLLLHKPPTHSPFHNFLAFSNHLHATHGRQHALSPDTLGRSLHDFLLLAGLNPAEVAQALTTDHLAHGARRPPSYLQPQTSSPPPPPIPNTLPHRQRRHQGGN